MKWSVFDMSIWRCWEAGNDIGGEEKLGAQDRPGRKGDIGEATFSETLQGFANGLGAVAVANH